MKGGGFCVYPNKLDQLYFLYVARNTEPLCRYKDLVHYIWKNYFNMDVGVRLAEIWSERLGIPFDQGYPFIVNRIADIYLRPGVCEKFQNVLMSVLFYQLLKKPWFIGFFYPTQTSYRLCPLIFYVFLNDDNITFDRGGGKIRENFKYDDPLLLQRVEDFDRIHGNNNSGKIIKRRFNA